MATHSFSLTDPYAYLECLPLSSCKNTWKRLDEKRADAIEQLTTCVHVNDHLRKCSMEVARVYRVSYRRLEEAAKCLGTIQRHYGKQYYGERRNWLSIGKAVEIRVYLRYRSPKKPSNNRHIELQIILGTRFTRRCDNLLAIGPRYWAEKAVEAISFVDPELAGYVESMMEVAQTVKFSKSGCRHLTPDNYGAEPGLLKRLWCNRVWGMVYGIGKVCVYDYRETRVYQWCVRTWHPYVF